MVPGCWSSSCSHKSQEITPVFESRRGGPGRAPGFYLDSTFATSFLKVNAMKFLLKLSEILAENHGGLNIDPEEFHGHKTTERERERP